MFQAVHTSPRFGFYAIEFAQWCQHGQNESKHNRQHDCAMVMSLLSKKKHALNFKVPSTKLKRCVIISVARNPVR